MKKLKKLEKNIYLDRKNRYVLRVYYTCPKTHKKKSSMTTLDVQTIEEAREILASKKQKEEQPQTQKPTLSDYAEQWIEARAKHLSPNTLDKRISHLAHHILPDLGAYMCDQITRADVQAWSDQAKTKRGDDGELYARDTLLNWWGTFSEVLRDMAADLGLPDPTLRVKSPLVKRAPKRERRTLTMEQLSKFVEVSRCTSRHAEVVTLAYTGMRAGELYGLKWSDLDHDAEIIHIRRSYSRGTWVEGGKTGVARRAYLHPKIDEALKAHRLYLLKTQNAGLRDDLVFPANNGRPRSSSSSRKALKTISEAIGLDFVASPQVLRRTFNTLMGQAQVDAMVIRAQMGHSTPAMTEYYTHVSGDRIKAGVISVFK